MRRPLNTAIAVVCILCGLIISVRVLLLIPRVPDPYSDFVGDYAAATLLRTGHPPYDRDAERAMRPQLVGTLADPDAVVEYFYPPWFLLVILPFTWLTVSTANVCWTVLQGVGVGGLCAFRLVSRLSPIQAGLVLSWLPVWLPTMVTLKFGQVSLLLLLAFLGLADAVRRRNDVTAGLWLACLSVKPTHMVAPIVLLVACRRWKSLIVTGIALLILVVITVSAFGVDLLGSYVDRLHLATHLQVANRSWHESTYSLAGLIRSTRPFSWLPLLLVDLGTLGVLLAILHAYGDAEAAAALPVASLLISPHVLVYDLMISVAAAPAIMRRGVAALPLLGGGLLLVWIAHVVVQSPSLVVLWLLLVLITIWLVPPR